MIYDLMRRTRTYHASSLATFEWDVTDTLKAIEDRRADGREVNFAAFLTKATATVTREFPRLNARVFHGVTGPREVHFDEVSCNLVVRREAEGGPRLVSTVIRDADKMSLAEISATVRRYKSAPVTELPEFHQLDKLKRIPRVLTKLHDYLVRSRPNYFIRHFGTYGLSAIVHEGSGMSGGFTPTPNTTYFPMRIGEQAAVRSGAIVPRTMLLFGIGIDHQVVDGMELVQAAQRLKVLMEEPAHLLETP